jgi:hypothetical protein
LCFFFLIGLPSAPYSPYKILETDYTSYALVYSCISLIFVKIEFAWILIRPDVTPPDQTKLNQFKEVYRRNGIDPSAFGVVPQDCADDEYVLDANGNRQDQALGQQLKDLGRVENESPDADDGGITGAEKNKEMELVASEPTSTQSTAPTTAGSNLTPLSSGSFTGSNETGVTGPETAGFRSGVDTN